MNLKDFKNQLSLSDETSFTFEADETELYLIEDDVLYLDDYIIEAVFNFEIVGKITEQTYDYPSTDEREMINLICREFKSYNLKEELLIDLNEEQREDVLKYFSFDFI